MALVLIAGWQADSLPWWLGVPTGPHAVGFRSYSISRAAAGGDRSIQVALWYPAAGPAGRRLRLGELAALDAATDPDRPAGAVTPLQWLAAGATGTDSLAPPFEAALGAPLRSIAGARTAPGRWPAVVWGSRHGTPTAQAPLSELLASHGHVVLAAWSPDAPLTFPWENRPASEKAATIAAQVGDLLAAIASAEAQLDTTRVTLIAWSYGGRTAAELAKRLTGISSMVSLDANVAPDDPDAPFALGAPFLWLVGRDTTRRGVERRFGPDSRTTIGRLPAITHGNFNSLEGYLPGLLAVDRVPRWSTPGPIAVQGYRALMRIVLTWVTAATAGRPVSPADLAAAAGNVAIEVRTAGK
ncbi:MAG: hypothetical protein AB7L66_13140 [Gemmatimonadales bacterium]